MAYDSFANNIKRGFLAMPDAIRVLILINTIVYVLQLISESFFGISLASSFGLVSDGYYTIFQPWRIITYMFLHSTLGITHYLFNMLLLWWIGSPVEQNLGPRSFLTVYFVAGFLGAIINVILTFAGIPTLIIGASGAIYGIMVAFAMLFPRMPVSFFFLPPVEARYLIAGFIVLNVLFLGAGDQVARIVHLGGALGGFLLMRAHRNGFDLSLIPRYIEYQFRKFKSSGSSKPKKNKNMSIVSDADVIEEVDQSELDEILEKISKKGYDALSSEEKRKLFELSKKD